MKGEDLGRKFYRKMFGLVLLIPVVLYIDMSLSCTRRRLRFPWGWCFTWPGEDGLKNAQVIAV